MGKKTISIVAVVLAVALVVVGVLFIQQKQTITSIQAQQAELTAEAADKDSQIEALSAEAADKDSQIEALSAEAADKDSQIEALSAEAADKDSQIEALSAEAADKDSQIEALSAEAADKDSQIEALNAQAADKDSQIEALNAQAADKDSQIEALNAQAADKDSQIEALSAEAADKASQIEALNAQAADKDSQIEALSAEAAGKATQIEALSAETADKDATIESLTAELEQMRQSNAKPEIPDSVPGKYSTTREFLYALEQADIDYTYGGLDSKDRDAVTVDIACAGHSVTFRWWFYSDCEDVAMRVWDIITFDSQEKTSVRTVCDQLNQTYRLVCFHLEDDNTVTMSMDFIVRPDGTSSDILLEGLLRTFDILEDSYPTLELYDN